MEQFLVLRTKLLITISRFLKSIRFGCVRITWACDSINYVSFSGLEAVITVYTASRTEQGGRSFINWYLVRSE